MTTGFSIVTPFSIRTVSQSLSRHRPVRLARRMRTASVAMKLVTPADAHARKAEGWKHLDVRTETEFADIRATNSVNVPFMNAASEGMEPNPGFLDAVADKFDKDDKIIVSCKSGVRSARACDALSRAGYSNVVDMDGGMNSYSSDPALPKE